LTLVCSFQIKPSDLLHAKYHEDIDEVICQLSEELDMALEVEDDVAGFLGVEIKKDRETGVVMLKQKGLKLRVLEALKLIFLLSAHQRPKLLARTKMVSFCTVTSTTQVKLA
jgi:hypothetical protein